MRTAIHRVCVWTLCALSLFGIAVPSYGQSIDAAKLRGIVLDDDKAELAGAWKPSTHTRPFVGAGYRHDDNVEKGVKSATFKTRLPASGLYHVLISYTTGDNRATNTPVDVYAADGSKTIQINQKLTPPLAGFLDLGEFEFKADQDAVVIIANTETNGHVIIDAVQFVTAAEFKLVLEDAKKNAPLVAKTEPPKPAPEPPAKFERIAPPEKLAKITAEKIDELLSKHLGDMSAAPLVSDEIFLRRLTLDIAGRQPTVAELKAFTADAAADKRAKAVDRLLVSSDYGRNWANYWSDVVGSRQQEPELTFHDYSPFKQWLAGQMNEGAAWDEVAFKMLTAQGKVGDNPAGTFIAFHQADEKKLAGETSRVFLSVQIACAECHDHPFVEMPMETFHGMAAFFVRTQAKIPWNDSSQIELVSEDKGEHKIPGKKDEMKPIALSGIRGGETYEIGLPDVARAKLAQWIVHPQNPFFARAYVNRVFARLMGRGFYEPVDDMGETAETPILRDVQDALAAHFIASGHDHKDVVRLLANTRAYQRTISAGESADEKPLAAATLKKLRGDEVFDSLVTAIGLPNVTPPKEKPTDAVRFPIPPKSTRDLVNEAFGYDPSFKDDLLVRSMKQAMFMMNNQQLQKQIDARLESETYLAKLLAEDKDDSTAAKRLYQAVLARSPSEKELSVVLAHVAKANDRGAAFEDVLWSLINSAEIYDTTVTMISPFLHLRNNVDGVTSRREFLKKLTAAGAATGVLQLGWRDLLITQAAELQKRGKRMILLWMDGGPSQFETFNPKIGSENQGPAKAIQTKLTGVEFAEYWPKTAEIADKLAIIRSMDTTEADHFRAIKLLKTGYPINPTIAYPTWGSVVAHERHDPEFDLPAFVRIGKPRIKTRDVNSGVLGAKYESFKIDALGKIPDDVIPTVPPEVLNRRLALADQLDAEFASAGAADVVKEKKDTYDRTARFVLSPKVEVFNLASEPDKLRDEYGRTVFGQGCLLARRLAEAGVSFIEVFSIGTRNDQGWDTHKTGFGDTPPLCAEVDPAYSTLLRDLEDRGMLEDTLVVWMGEFGRTPKIKPDGGRDHYAEGWITCLSGAGVKVGQVIGATDKDGVKVTDRPLGVADLFVTFCKILGLDPNHEYFTPQNQPLKLVKGGKVIEELF